MKLLDRYVGRQVIVTTLFAVAVLSVVLVVGRAFKDLLELLVNHNVPLEIVLSFLGYILPFSLTFTIPWGFLTAILLVFGKMSAENELVALRSNGVSILRICLSVFVLSLVCVGVCLWINVEVAPKAQSKMKNALFDIAVKTPLAMFGSDRVIDAFPGQKIYVERSEGTQLYNLLIYQINDAFDPMRVVFAHRGEIETDQQNKQMLLHIYDARFEQRDEQRPSDLMRIRQGITMEKSTFPISLEELYRKNQKRKGIGTLTVNELIERIDTDAKTGADPKRAVAQLSALKTEISKRFSFALASFAFALIGVPLAITAHRKETSIGFLLSLIVAFVYFFFIIIADSVREDPAMHPELLIWAPNVLFIGLGAILFYRLSKH